MPRVLLLRSNLFGTYA